MRRGGGMKTAKFAERIGRGGADADGDTADSSPNSFPETYRSCVPSALDPKARSLERGRGGRMKTGKFATRMGTQRARVRTRSLKPIAAVSPERLAAVRKSTGLAAQA